MALMNLAQSFRVINRPGGCFATKIDLYFSSLTYLSNYLLIKSFLAKSN